MMKFELVKKAKVGEGKSEREKIKKKDMWGGGLIGTEEYNNSVEQYEILWPSSPWAVIV